MYRHSYALFLFELPVMDSLSFISIWYRHNSETIGGVFSINRADWFGNCLSERGIWAAHLLPGCKQWLSTSYFFTCWRFASQFPSSKSDHRQSCWEIFYLLLLRLNITKLKIGRKILYTLSARLRIITHAYASTCKEIVRACWNGPASKLMCGAEPHEYINEQLKRQKFLLAILAALSISL